uniref:Ubiquitin-like domain-containing protein n=1 Tax=Lotharella oceanica TaxID=641309 RepID=A0A7S2X6W4_9EUKA
MEFSIRFNLSADNPPQNFPYAHASTRKYEMKGDEEMATLLNQLPGNSKYRIFYEGEVISDSPFKTLSDLKITDGTTLVAVAEKPFEKELQATLPLSKELEELNLSQYVSVVEKKQIRMVEAIAMLESEKRWKSFACEKIGMKPGHAARLRRLLRDKKEEAKSKEKKREDEKRAEQQKLRSKYDMSRSTDAKHSFSMNVSNESGKRIVAYWVDYQGKEKRYWACENGRSRNQQTFATHPWRFRDGENGEEVAWFVLRNDEIAQAGSGKIVRIEVTSGEFEPEMAKKQC